MPVTVEEPHFRSMDKHHRQTHARWVPDPTVQVGDLAGERSATLIENQRREIEHLKLQRENAQMRATLAEQSSGSHRGGSVKGSIPDM